MGKQLELIGRGPHSAVEERACRTCGMVSGTNRGRCSTCFDAWADWRLASYFDWLQGELPRANSVWRLKAEIDAKRRMLEALEQHGPLLIPR
jgi:hypothetical protein